MRNLLLLALVLMVSAPLRAATYYIDYAGGSDSNAGTSTGAAWKTAPGMSNQGARTYSHNAGDRFIFKGGTTWSNACFQWVISDGGSAGNPDYYGADQTWYSGGTFTRPKFDFSGVTNTSCRVYSTADYLTLDNIELAGNRPQSGTNYVGSSTVWLSGSGTSINQCHVHGWLYCDNTLGNDYILVCHGQFLSNVVDGTESLIGGKANGRALGLLSGGTAVGWNVVSNVSNGIFTPPPPTACEVFSNVVANILEASGLTYSGTPEHGNAVYVFGSGSIHHNIIHDVFAGYQTLYIESSSGSTSTTNVVYNNLIYNPGSACVVLESDLGTGAYSSLALYNNTLVGGAAQSGVRVVARPVPPYVVCATNNQFICDGDAWGFGNTGNGDIVVPLIGNNLTNTTMQATVAGYVVDNLFQPTSTNSPTVGVGVDLSSVVPTDLLGVTRVAPLDIGAYEYSTTPTNSPAPASGWNVGNLSVGTLRVQ